MNEYSDETLCRRAASGDRIAEEVLVTRYHRLVRICARPYFLAGGDSEDLIQEGMFGLLKAVREYDAEKETSFHTYAEVCIRNRILSAVSAAARDKHAPLNHGISIESPLFEGHSDFYALRDSLSQEQSPEDMLIGLEEQQERINTLKDSLSPLEGTILDLYLSGFSYQEIADRTGKSLKSVDNAVQRIRRKVARQLIPAFSAKADANITSPSKIGLSGPGQSKRG